jgi:hypothetical protein
VTAFKVLIVLVVVLLASLVTYGCREYRIDQCHDKDMEAVVPPWFSNDPAGVSCIHRREGRTGAGTDERDIPALFAAVPRQPSLLPA